MEQGNRPPSVLAAHWLIKRPGALTFFGYDTEKGVVNAKRQRTGTTGVLTLTRLKRLQQIVVRSGRLLRRGA